MLPLLFLITDGASTGIEVFSLPAGLQKYERRENVQMKRQSPVRALYRTCWKTVPFAQALEAVSIPVHQTALKQSARTCLLYTSYFETVNLIGS